MFLPSLVTLRHPASRILTPEDLFESSLGGVFEDDLQNQHGDDPDTVIEYQPSNALYKKLELHTADVNGEEQRRKFAHYLWNAGILMAELVAGAGEQNGDRGWKEGKWWTDTEEEAKWSVRGETVLELGAGVGLGGIMSILAGADSVDVTDYPASPIIDTMSKNMSENLSGSLRARTGVYGHQWGDFDSKFATEHAGYYTRILAADCLWMPHEHENLALSMQYFLSPHPAARVYVIAGFHTGRAKIAPFFEDVVPQHGLEVEEIYEMNAEGQRRPWAKERDGGREDVGERKKWLVVARLRRSVSQWPDPL